MARAINLLRADPDYHREDFSAGLRACGFELEERIASPQPEDLLLVWNRYGRDLAEAARFEAAGATVLVAENGYLGKLWRGAPWFALARTRHNGLGTWNEGGPERWDSWGVELAPWRTGGEEVLFLNARGIGADPVRQPPDFLARAIVQIGRLTRLPIRVRHHPGRRTDAATPLEADWGKASACATWGSTAALKALLAGIPVFHGLRDWIGAPAARYLGTATDLDGRMDDERRLETFRRLAWAMWSRAEIADGSAIAYLLRR